MLIIVDLARIIVSLFHFITCFVPWVNIFFQSKKEEKVDDCRDLPTDWEKAWVWCDSDTRARAGRRVSEWHHCEWLIRLDWMLGSCMSGAARVGQCFGIACHDSPDIGFTRF